MTRLAVLAAVASIPPLAAGEPPRPQVPSARPDEPLAKTFSLDKGVEFLDSITFAWVHRNQCFSCHTRYQYLLSPTSVSDWIVSNRRRAIAARENSGR